MNTRRDALKLMAAGLGACVLPSIGFSQTRSQPNIMGIDQREGHLNYIISTPTTGTCGDCDFEHLPGLMDRYKIDQCVIDLPPSTLDTVVFARQFPNRVTVCRWRNQKLVNGRWKNSCGDYVPGKFLLYEKGTFGSYKIVYAIKKAWGHPRQSRRDDVILYTRIADFIQTAT